MKKKLMFLVLALVMMAGAQALTPTAAEAATCGRVCPPNPGGECVCCEWCCTLSSGAVTCSDMPCYC
jgi:hypothetical protein